MSVAREEKRRGNYNRWGNKDGGGATPALETDPSAREGREIGGMWTRPANYLELVQVGSAKDRNRQENLLLQKGRQK